MAFCMCSKNHTCFSCREALTLQKKAREAYEESVEQLQERERNLARQEANEALVDSLAFLGKGAYKVASEHPLATGIGLGLGALLMVGSNKKKSKRS